MSNYYKYPIERACLNWDQTMQQLAGLADGSQLVIFGAGLHSIPLFYRLKDLCINVIYFCDNDSVKWGKTYCGKRIITPDELVENKENYYVLIGADCYADEIQRGLEAKGFPTDQIVSVREHSPVGLVVPGETIAGRDDLESAGFVIRQAKEKETPLVTVRITVYNEPLYYIKRAVESILAQTFTAFHLVIIENGASEATGKLISDYAAADKRIEIISYQKNGIRFDPEYQTKYFCKLDADDYYEPTFLERAISAAELNDAEIVAVNSIWYEENMPERIRYMGSLDTDDIVVRGPAEVVGSAIEHLQMFTANWAKLVKTSFYFLHMDVSPNSIPDSLVGYFKETNIMVIISEVLHYWTRRSSSVSNRPGGMWDNWRDISLFHVYERIYLAFVKTAIDCGVFNECNAAILRQNFMTQLKLVVLPRLQSNALFQPDIVAGIINEMLNSNSVIKDLPGLAEYDRFRSDLSELGARMQKEGI